MKATFLAGSPAIWSRVGAYCRQNNIILPTVKSVAMFGAPVSINVHEDFQNVLTEGTTFTPYGATECLPIANVSGREILSSFKDLMVGGQGTCLGQVFSAMEVGVFRLNCDDTLGGAPCRRGDWGEICVSGAVMTQKYLKNELKTTQSKFIYNDKTWHRMGDLGYFDENQNLWFGGRISHRVYVENIMVAPIPVEALANSKINKKRSALVKDLDGASIIIETNNPKELSRNDLMTAIKKNIFKININKIYTIKKFPVDVRHNIKIDRLQLRHDLVNGKLKEL
jgi:acyl-CoA synthetase (AMP-forming)/AMP-acid ligase II